MPGHSADKDSDLACQWGKQRRAALDQGCFDLVIAALEKHADRGEEAARNVTCLNRTIAHTYGRPPVPCPGPVRLHRRGPREHARQSSPTV